MSAEQVSAAASALPWVELATAGFALLAGGLNLLGLRKASASSSDLRDAMAEIRSGNRENNEKWSEVTLAAMEHVRQQSERSADAAERRFASLREHCTEHRQDMRTQVRGLNALVTELIGQRS
ncbi:hypothetical protein [Aquipuribacter nitratireducens]|uniref:Chemotaxis protein n=1 Tax=Aquipuribacter nitratireducens TaxID=650104 RepID=A0ABW0GTC4_9MICO